MKHSQTTAPHVALRRHRDLARAANVAMILTRMLESLMPPIERAMRELSAAGLDDLTDTARAATAWDAAQAACDLSEYVDGNLPVSATGEVLSAPQTPSEWARAALADVQVFAGHIASGNNEDQFVPDDLARLCVQIITVRLLKPESEA